MKIDVARKRIVEYQEYVDAYENYHPANVTEEAVKLYAAYGNVKQVATELNELGYRKDGKLVAGQRMQVKLISNDVTGLLNGEIKAGDQLHGMVKKALNKNRRRKGIVT